ncbi:hypothetical protein GVN21_03975 [Caulobacter sp. SLTY]|uniref:hypothetical protein n=1 Tax=Caulobacter sp. SLTY TaxID=2683262 RepID=UPI001411E59C|nr:hypothetical protein [Caulobacter sp. SLTY]NBB14516.1 hypothetical protein [Caulobacter sp. SLTY]
MRRLLPVLAAALFATTAFAQGVEVAPLAAPDVFSGGSRDTGLGEDLWKGSSAELARRIMPTIGGKPLSPAGRLLALGEPLAANASVERIPNAAADPALAEVVAETALLTGADDRACQTEQAVAIGRGEVYWLRLRAYCQAIAGQTDAAQLTVTLAQEKARDPVFGRLMTALLVQAEPGDPSARNGLDTALSRRLGLTLPIPASADLPLVLVNEAGLQCAGRSCDLLAAALGQPVSGEARLGLFDGTGKSAAAPGRLAALQVAADRGLVGETGLIAVAILQDAPKTGLPPHDRAAVIRALVKVGLVQDARGLATEGAFE